MDFIMRGFKKHEFILALRIIAKTNQIETGIITYTDNGHDIIAKVADAVIGKLTQAQFRELNSIK